MNSQILPATAALESQQQHQLLPSHEYTRRKIALTKRRRKATARKNRQSTFDMVSLLDAAEPIEQSISFPAIEWSIDDDATDETDSSLLPPFLQSLDSDDGCDSNSSSASSLGKRCRDIDDEEHDSDRDSSGLSRSKRKTCLATLTAADNQLSPLLIQTFPKLEELCSIPPLPLPCQDVSYKFCKAA